MVCRLRAARESRDRRGCAVRARRARAVCRRHRSRCAEGLFRQKNTARSHEAAAEQGCLNAGSGNASRRRHDRQRYPVNMPFSRRDIDWTLLLVTLAICAVGVLQIYSATRDTDYTSAWWKQVIYIGGGLIFMWIAMSIDYHAMLHSVPILYGLSVLALLVTAV